MSPQKTYGSISSTVVSSSYCDSEESQTRPETIDINNSVWRNRQPGLTRGAAVERRGGTTEEANCNRLAPTAIFLSFIAAFSYALLCKGGGGGISAISSRAHPFGQSSRLTSTGTNALSAMSADLLALAPKEDFSLVYPMRPFGTRHGRNVTLPVLGFPSVALARLADPLDQSLANEAVRHAVLDLGIRYFDVAPEYGDGVAQERLGPALQPFLGEVFLAAKTMFRSAEGAATDLANTLKALKTDHLNLYQFHSISTEQDVNDILSEGGAMETFQKAKREGVIDAVGFSAHSEPMAVRMIETGLVDTVMFPINFVAYHYGGIGKKVLEAAIKYQVGVIALKAGARGRLTNVTGNEIHVPDKFNHIPEWKRQEMIKFPVRTSKTHPTCWYEPEDDPEELNRLILWSLNQPGVTAVLPPGSLDLLDGIANMLLKGKGEVPPFDEADMQHMLDRYRDIVPIFHDRDESGTKVST